MKLLPPRKKNDCLESKFECRTDTIGLNLAAVSTVVRNAQGSSLAKLSFKGPGKLSCQAELQGRHRPLRLQRVFHS